MVRAFRKLNDMFTACVFADKSALLQIFSNPAGTEFGSRRETIDTQDQSA